MTSFYPDQTSPILITDKSTMMADLKKEEFVESMFFFPLESQELYTTSQPEKDEF